MKNIFKRKWEATATDYHSGKVHLSWRKKSALAWLEKNQHYDKLYLLNRWSGEKETIKNLLKDARFCMGSDGIVHVIYNN